MKTKIDRAAIVKNAHKCAKKELEQQNHPPRLAYSIKHNFAIKTYKEFLTKGFKIAWRAHRDKKALDVKLATCETKQALVFSGSYFVDSYISNVYLENGVWHCYGERKEVRNISDIVHIPKMGLTRNPYQLSQESNVYLVNYMQIQEIVKLNDELSQERECKEYTYIDALYALEDECIDQF